jgi:hypothetical protein
MVGSQVTCSCGDRLVLKCTDCTEAARAGQPVRPTGWGNARRRPGSATPYQRAPGVPCGDQLCRGQVVAATARMGSPPVASAGPGRRPVYWGVHTGNHRATVRPAVKLKATPPMQPCN